MGVYDHLQANSMSLGRLGNTKPFVFCLCRWGERAWSAFFTSCKTQWEISLALAEEGLHCTHSLQGNQIQPPECRQGYDFKKYIVSFHGTCLIWEFVNKHIAIYTYIYNIYNIFRTWFFPAVLLHLHKKRYTSSLYKLMLWWWEPPKPQYEEAASYAAPTWVVNGEQHSLKLT